MPKSTPLCRPAEAFETRHGFTGLSKRYVLPDGFTDESLQKWLFAQGRAQQRNGGKDLELALEQIAGITHRSPDAAPLGKQGVLKLIQEKEGLLQKKAALLPRWHKACLPVREMFDKLVTLNPELEPFFPKALRESLLTADASAYAVKSEITGLHNALFDIIHGIASGFLPEDIDVFIKRRSENYERQNAVESALGTGLGWVPSASTLDKIEAQMQHRGIGGYESAVDYVTQRDQGTTSLPRGGSRPTRKR